MESNIGEQDRLFRTIFGIFGMLLGFLFIQGVIGIILGVLGLVSTATGILGFCAIYKLLGMSTLEEPSPPVEPDVPDEHVMVEDLDVDIDDAEEDEEE